MATVFGRNSKGKSITTIKYLPLKGKLAKPNGFSF